MTADLDDPPAPPPGGDDADDAAWLLARAEGTAAAPPRASAARQYDALEDLIGELDPIAPPSDWQAKVLAQVDAPSAAPAKPRRRRWPLVAAPISAFAAVTAVWVAMRAPAVAVVAAPLSYETSSGGAPRGHGPVHVHDRLTASGRLRGAGALRLYRTDQTLLAECPRDAACSQHRDGAVVVHVLDLALDEPGRYYLMLLDGDVPPSTNSYNDDFAAARQAGVTSKIEPIDVQ